MTGLYIHKYSENAQSRPPSLEWKTIGRRMSFLVDMVYSICLDINIKLKNMKTETLNFSYGNSHYKIVALEIGITSIYEHNRFFGIESAGLKS